MAELIYDVAKIGEGERFFLVHIGRAPVGDANLADLDVDEVGSVRDSCATSHSFDAERDSAKSIRFDRVTS